MPVFGRRLQFWTSTLLYFFVLLFGPQVITATAQEPVGRLEAYGAYSLLRPNLPAGLGGDPAIERFLEIALSNVLGWNGGVTLNVNPTFGITGDVSGYYRSAEVTSQGEHVTGDLKVHTFLFGPRFRRPGETWRPFAHALLGVGHGTASGSDNTGPERLTRTGFTAAFGGGVDAAVHPRIAIRAIQFDYFPARSSNGDSITFQNYRWGTGIVVHLTR